MGSLYILVPSHLVFPSKLSQHILWHIPQYHMQVKHGYTSNCVRRGIAAGLGKAMKQLLHGHNIRYGRAINSTIDLDVYCPEEFLQAIVKT